MWRSERSDVACVREAFEETRLRVSVEKGLAEFDGAHFFLCKLLSGRDELQLRPRECIDAKWTNPTDILNVGTVMDLRRVIPVLKLAGLEVPKIPNGLVLADPTTLLC